MSNEITISGGLTLKIGDISAKLTGVDRKDIVGSHYVQRIDNISTTEEATSKGDIGTLGYCAFRNVSTEGVIRVGGVTGAYVLSIEPGEFAGPLKWATNAIFSIATIEGTRLEMLLLEV